MVRIMRMRSQSVLVGMVLCEEVRKKCSQALIPSLIPAGSSFRLLA